MKLVIGLVGEKGSGKETFGNLLQELFPTEQAPSFRSKKIVRVRYSDILVDTCNIWDVVKSRENLQKVAVVMEEGMGSGTLAHAMKVRVEKMRADIVIIDGVRWWPDLDLIRSFPNNLLVYITAPLKIRYQRLKKRQEKAYEETTSFKQFLKEEKAKNELLISKIGATADLKINNKENLTEFKKKIKEGLFSTLGKNTLSPQK